MLNKIKWAFQRMVRGYDDKFMWSMSDYLEYYFIPAIKKFCINRLENCNDKKFIKVYKEMLALIITYDISEYSSLEKDEASSKMWSHFGKNIAYFWD